MEEREGMESECSHHVYKRYRMSLGELENLNSIKLDLGCIRSHILSVSALNEILTPFLLKQVTTFWLKHFPYFPFNLDKITLI